MKCTLRVNMILGDGQHYARGSVLDRELIPAHLQKPEYIADGRVNVDITTPLQMIEIGDEEEEQPSPMQELTLPEEPKKPLVSRLKPKKAA